MVLVHVQVHKMPRSPIFLLAALFSLSWPCLSVECYNAPAALPSYRDCHVLLDGILYLSRLPGENRPKEWGRNLTTGLGVEHLPKLYWLDGPERYNCGIRIDGISQYATEIFRVDAVYYSGSRLVLHCLAIQRQLGVDWPGLHHQVTASLLWTGTNGFPDLLSGLDVQRMPLPNSSKVLMSASIQSTVYGNGMMELGKGALNFTSTS
ncbi:hypothetical protein N7G274_005709 [Stereocaulon virgatum]|uniref:Uncharacterized protein n=1 Tax=Stereocaulon virgatum TaxID=373712 RepID=A0ABR4AA44_9LECA